VIQTGELELDIPPHTGQDIRLPLELPAEQRPAEQWLDLSFRLKQALVWAEPGHEVAWAQFNIPPSRPVEKAAERTDGKSIELESAAAEIRAKGKDLVWTFSRESGQLESLLFRNIQLIQRGPTVNLWRAPTANELDEWRNPPIAETWYRLGLDRLRRIHVSMNVERDAENRPVILSSGLLKLPDGETIFEVETRYILYSDGTLRIETHLEPVAGLPDWMAGVTAWLPRIGHELEVAKSLRTFSWLGRGPFENYPDRNSGARVGTFSSEITDLYEPYLIPQEHGNRSEIRWATLTDEQGIGLRVEGNELLNMSLHRYSQDHLARANYTFQLEDSDVNYWYIDHQVTGVGGTPVPTLEKYRTENREYRWSYSIRPFEKPKNQ
ncbi:MAG: DUF4981 domain-containing protein, partial [Acidobacteriota bacterium]